MSIQLINHIRKIPDFPKPGILFFDITTILQDPILLKTTIDAMTAPYEKMHIDKVCGIESRGFIFAAAIAEKLEAGFVPVRKPGKLPSDKHHVSYDLEYGSDALEIHTDAVKKGEKVLVVDDLLATGGTAAATLKLIGKCGGEVVACCFVVELIKLGGRKKLGDVSVHALVSTTDG